GRHFPRLAVMGSAHGIGKVIALGVHLVVRGLQLRPELQAAHDEMDAKGDYFAYAVCRTHDGQAWEVTT
ncbi:hypothetical protein, partial [Aeromonas hydrophila]|uniref:hypothetical protein n=1 Tax=Aeromonas hydrophila TaxID=644 RepID=UPI001CC7A923